jgi:hypothetical protein
MAYLQCSIEEVLSCWPSVSAKQHLRCLVPPKLNSLILDKLKDQLRREETVFRY